MHLRVGLVVLIALAALAPLVIDAQPDSGHLRFGDAVVPGAPRDGEALEAEPRPAAAEPNRGLAASGAPAPAILPGRRAAASPVFARLEDPEHPDAGNAGFGREVYRERFVRARTDLAGDEALVWNLFDDLELRAERSELIEHDEDGSHFTWRGKIEGDPHSEVVAQVTDGRLTASIALSTGAIFSIDTLPSGVQRIREGNESALPGCGNVDHDLALGQTAAAAGTGGSSPPPPGVAAAGSEPIDLLFLYTPAAVASFGAGTTGLEDRLALVVAWANLIYENTGVDQRLRAAGMVEVAYDDSHGDGNTALEDVTLLDDGQIEEAGDLRNQYGADMVTLVTSPSNVCGIAWVATAASQISWYDYYMFSVMNILCTGNGKALAHELGHNQGAYHDLETSLAQGMTQAEIDAVVAPNSFGYVAPGDTFHTTMAYASACSGCVYVQHFATPLLSYEGQPTGDTSANVRETLEATHISIAAFRNATLCSGSGDFDSDGVCDNVDNCTEAANPSQLDTDLDGFGNRCDGDYNNDGAVGLPDYFLISQGFGFAQGESGFDERFDHDGDGVVGVPDWILFTGLFGGYPGPSALACTPPASCGS